MVMSFVALLYEEIGVLKNVHQPWTLALKFW